MILVFSSLCLTSSHIFCQTYSSIVSDKDIIEFIDYISTNDIKGYNDTAAKAKRICKEILDFDSSQIKFPVIHYSKDGKAYSVQLNLGYAFTLMDDSDSILKLSEIKYLLSQCRNFKSHKWRQKSIGEHIVRNSKDPSKNPIHYFSIPIFSQDKKTAIVSHEYYCGPLCAWGNIRVYRKDNSGKWKKVFQTMGWRS